MKSLLASVTLACLAAILLCFGAQAPAAAANPFVEGAYLYNQAFDTNIYSPNDGIQGSGDWLSYYNWLGYSSLGAEGDPGESSGDWWDCCGNVSWNGGWAAQQARYGSALGPIILGIGQMPYSPTGYNLTWENQEWANEAADDATEMANFKAYVDSLHADGFAANSVIIRMGYEFDGGWNSWGNLNQMSNMPANYIAAWQNIVTAMRAEDATYPIHVLKGFVWNPTDGNVQINSFSYYPGDAYVDYIGIDTYDYDYSSGEYTTGVQPTAAEQQAEWPYEKARLDPFATFASSGNTTRPGYGGSTIPLIFCEWGLWQVASLGRPAGGDNPYYIQNMYDWMTNPANDVYMESYFEAPADGISSLSPIFDPNLYPNAEATYLSLYGGSGGYSGEASYGNGGSPWPISGTISNTNYDTGGEQVGYYDTTAGNTGGAYRSDDVDISASGDTGYGNGYCVGWAANGEWLRYSVSVSTAGTYNVAFRVANGGSTDGTFHLQNSAGTNLTGAITVAPTGGWSTWTTVNATVTLPAGPQVLTLYEDTAQYNFDCMTFTAQPTNYLTNSGFETGDLSDWSLWVGANSGAAYAGEGTGEAHTGTWGYVNWSTSPYQLTLYQTVTVPNGNHTVSAWVKSSGGQYECRMEVTPNGGSPIYVNFPTTSTWTQISTPVDITTGGVTVGFYSNALANQWMNVDDVSVN